MIDEIIGLCTGKMRSTPMPLEILRTVKDSLTPLPRRAMHTPSNAWRRSLSPSFTRTLTRSVSPARKAGTSVRSHSFWVSINGCIRSSGQRLGCPGYLCGRTEKLTADETIFQSDYGLRAYADPELNAADPEP